ncbi:Uncharacterised protein [Mycobacteroides abscessus subsp. abscessus]|nr:Uncharacterised protein [Mycobacteroides abscessus subsp. abscessus]
MNTCLWSNAATNARLRLSSIALPKTSPLISPIPATANESRSTSISISERWRRTLTQAPLAVMPIFLWS